MGKKRLDVQSAKKLISQDIQQVCRKESEEQKRGKRWESIRDPRKKRSVRPKKEAVENPHQTRLSRSTSCSHQFCILFFKGKTFLSTSSY